MLKRNQYGATLHCVLWIMWLTLTFWIIILLQTKNLVIFLFYPNIEPFQQPQSRTEWEMGLWIRRASKRTCFIGPTGLLQSLKLKCRVRDSRSKVQLCTAAVRDSLEPSAAPGLHSSTPAPSLSHSQEPKAQIPLNSLQSEDPSGLHLGYITTQVLKVRAAETSTTVQ